MTILFWMLWALNVLMLLLAIVGKGFRSSFGAGVDLNVLMIVGLLVVLIVSLVLRIAVKQKWVSLVVVSLPLIGMLLLYGVEKMTGKTL
jgi:hypothetical protein